MSGPRTRRRTEGTVWTSLLRPALVRAGAYSPGVSAAETAARYGLSGVVRLNWNENLSGPLPGVLDEVAAELAEVWAYPETAYGRFTEAVAEWTGLRPEQVLPGHGIQSLVHTVVAAFLDPGDAVIIPRPTYGLYLQACQLAGATAHRVDTPGSLALELPAIAAAAREHGAKLAWVCDPNNPTGLRLCQADWDDFLNALPDGCVAVADEAYGDYIEPGERVRREPDVAGGRPVIVLRTFSKVFGLAGLRMGYALAHETLTPYLHAVQEPFTVNRAALTAGIASLRVAAERPELLAGRRELDRLARERLTRPLTGAGLRCLDSDANFVLVELGADDRAVGEILARQGLLVRPGSEFGLPGFARVTTGDPGLMDLVAQRLLEAVATWR